MTREHLLSHYSANTSVQALPKASQSNKRWVVIVIQAIFSKKINKKWNLQIRLLWGVVFVAGLVATVYHVSTTVIAYFEYPIESTVCCYSNMYTKKILSNKYILPNLAGYVQQYEPAFSRRLDLQCKSDQEIENQLYRKLAPFGFANLWPLKSSTKRLI